MLTFLASAHLHKGVELTDGQGIGLHPSNAHNTLILLHCASKYVCVCVLSNNAVKCYDYIVSMTDEWMSKEHWWNDIDRGKTEVLKEKKKPIPGPLFKHKYCTAALGSGTQWRLHERPVTNCKNHGMAFVSRGKGFTV